METKTLGYNQAKRPSKNQEWIQDKVSEEIQRGGKERKVRGQQGSQRLKEENKRRILK
jgi:hypothetical protein